jgi:hypothetical protein
VCHPLKAHGWKREQVSKCKQHNWLSLIVKVCCKNDDTNQCPGWYIAKCGRGKNCEMRTVMRTGTQLDFKEAYWYAAQFLATMRTGTHLNFYWTYFGTSRQPDY